MDDFIISIFYELDNFCKELSYCQVIVGNFFHTRFTTAILSVFISRQEA